MSTPVYIIGCGDIGRRVAALCQLQQIKTFAWVKSATSLKRCLALNLPCQQLDCDQTIAWDKPASHKPANYFYTIPPPKTGIEDTRLSAFLASITPENIKNFVLISTTGVYGNCDGDWIDESRPIKPIFDRAKRRASAEAALNKWAEKHKINITILRVPGIYAADRLPVKRLLSGEPVLNAKAAPWTNRIHADDLAAVCMAALHSKTNSKTASKPISNIINVADDAPSNMTDYFFEIADKLHLPRPPEISLKIAQKTLSTGIMAYLSESRRIKNHKMKKVLGITLKYPTLKAGLKNLKQASELP